MSSHQPIPPWSLKDPWNEWPEGQEFPRWRPAPPGAYPREAAPTNETPSKSATSSQLPSRRSQTPPRQTSPVQAPCSQESPRQASTRTATPQPASSANPQRKREREGSSRSLREQLLKKPFKTNKSSQQSPNVPKQMSVRRSHHHRSASGRTSSWTRTTAQKACKTEPPATISVRTTLLPLGRSQFVSSQCSHQYRRTRWTGLLMSKSRCDHSRPYPLMTI
jgi:hypothetical protein